MTTPDAPRAGRLLMNLYPVHYRAAHGEDIAAVFAETTEGLPGRAVLRERFDLAAHALRLRLRIGPTDPAGRVLAGAAPVALAIVAGRCLFFLLPQLHPMVHRLRYPYPNLGLGYAVQGAILLLAGNLPWLLALAFAVTGRWKAARITGALAALVGVGVLWSLGVFMLWEVGPMVSLAAVGALLLLAPSGLVDVTARGRWEAAGLALGIAVPMLAVAHYQIPLLESLFLWDGTFWLYTATAVVLLLRLSGRRPDVLRAAGVALGPLPWLLPLAFAALDGSEPLFLLAQYGGACLVPLGAAAAGAGVVQLVRRARAGRPSPSA
ncbi:hypothetical protein [Kitasatospora phosalacinea]|uniref:hypothetical protein n=1 Tax=Kitasatospora phosalacinea TaxID=2065 RepID=UPI00068F7826|nr:hypothetical protein [Kitasatospora phosalacinea]